MSKNAILVTEIKTKNSEASILSFKEENPFYALLENQRKVQK